MRMKVYRIIIHRGAFSPYYSNLKQFFSRQPQLKISIQSIFIHSDISKSYLLICLGSVLFDAYAFLSRIICIYTSHFLSSLNMI